MVLRGADYPRKASEDYCTPAEPVLALIPHLVDIRVAWVPSDRGSDSVLAATLRAHCIETVSTDVDFLTVREPPAGADAIVDNPPFGRGVPLVVASSMRFAWCRSQRCCRRPISRARAVARACYCSGTSGLRTDRRAHQPTTCGRSGTLAAVIAARPSSITKPNPICPRVGAGFPFWWPPTRPAAASQRSFRVKD
jgi:hypothetical protein